MKTLLLRSTYLLAIIVLSAGMQSCDKIKDKFFPGFEAEPSDLQIALPIIGSTTSASPIVSVTTYFNMDSIIKAETLNAFSIKNVESITVQELTLTIADGDNENNFGNLESIAVSLHSNVNTTPTMIASAPLIADQDVNELTLSPVASNNLRGYMTGSYLTYTISGKARKVTTKPLTCMLHMRLKMN
jgi:hypothetical protein